MDTIKWILCPICRNKTRDRMREDTELINYPLYCPKCKQERFETLVGQMKQAQGITEQLKAEKPMEWVQRMNNIRACAAEIVNTEIIYV